VGRGGREDEVGSSSFALGSKRKLGAGAYDDRVRDSDKTCWVMWTHGLGYGGPEPKITGVIYLFLRKHWHALCKM